MTYYKVRPEYDNKQVARNGYYLIAHELYTPAELRKLEKQYNRYAPEPRNFMRMFKEVEVSKSSVYFFFGARFSPTTGGRHGFTPTVFR